MVEPYNILNVIYFGYSCTFESYTPPFQRREYLYPCMRDVYVRYFSTCPASYSKWKLSKDCDESSVSLVYWNPWNFLTSVYKNSYCAICHLGDSIRFAETNTPVPSSLELITDIPQRRTNYHYIIPIRFSYESRRCCLRCRGDSSHDDCQPFGDMRWGEIWNDNENTCLPAPFNTTCYDTDFDRRPFSSQEKLKIQYLCPNFKFNCKLPTNPMPTFQKGPQRFADNRQTDPEESPINRLFFADNRNTEYENDQLVVNAWPVASNQTFKFCANGVIFTTSNDSGVAKIILSNGKIQVRLQTISYIQF